VRAARPTIRDVAAEAGVSVKTVSRVLNGEPSVLPDTAERVRAAVAALNFHRDEAAADLRRHRKATSVVGLIIDDLSNPFYSTVAHAIDVVGREHGYHLLVASSEESVDREGDLIRALRARRVDGLIVVPTGGRDSCLATEAAAGTAIVLADRPAAGVHADTVLAGNVQGAYDAVTHLLRAGHRRIGFIGGPAGLYTATERYRGYADALAAEGVPVDEALVRRGPRTVDAAQLAACELLSLADPATALFAADNRATVGALRAVRRRGAPAALVGFDDFELADLLDPPVTVVAQDGAALGRTAAELLFRRIGGDQRPLQQVTLETVLVPRGSGEVTV
jgi:LacI family transcriptional regulator